MIFFLFILFTVASAHITFTPNYGAPSGWYFATSMKVPHGKPGHFTTKIEVSVPYGVLTVKPEDVSGWDITIQERDITPYVSHGKTVTKGPSKIIYQAQTALDALDDKHLMTVDFQTKIGCDFKSSETTNTEWQGEYTLWWPTKQFYSVENSLDIIDVDEWTGIPKNKDSAWATATPKPCPYTFIYSGDKCINEQDKSQVGLTWDNVLVPVALDQNAIENVAHVKSLLNEEILDLNETFTERLNSLDRISTYYDVHIIVSIVALVFSVLSFGLIFGFVLARATCSQKKYASMLGVPLVQGCQCREMEAN